MVESPQSKSLALDTAANMAEFFSGGARDSGQRYIDGQFARASDRQMQDPLANSAFITASIFEPAEVAATLTSFYKETGSAWVLWCPSLDPDFSTYGLIPLGDPPLMLRQSLPTTIEHPMDLDIREVLTAAELRDFNRTFHAGYPVHHPVDDGNELFGAGVLGTANRFWNGYVNGTCVAVASATRFAGVLTVNAVATLPEYRRRGYGAAVTHAAARSAPNLPVLLLASDDGRPVYERLGFETIGHFRLWLHQ